MPRSLKKSHMLLEQIMPKIITSLGETVQLAVNLLKECQSSFKPSNFSNLVINIYAKFQCNPLGQFLPYH